MRFRSFSWLPRIGFIHGFPQLVLPRMLTTYCYRVSQKYFPSRLRPYLRVYKSDRVIILTRSSQQKRQTFHQFTAQKTQACSDGNVLNFASPSTSFFGNNLQWNKCVYPHQKSQNDFIHFVGIPDKGHAEFDTEFDTVSKSPETFPSNSSSTVLNTSSTLFELDQIIGRVWRSKHSLFHVASVKEVRGSHIRRSGGPLQVRIICNHFCEITVNVLSCMEHSTDAIWNNSQKQCFRSICWEKNLEMLEQWFLHWKLDAKIA